jgi:hypothetical protein
MESYRLAVELRDRLLAELNENEIFKAFQHAQEIVSALARTGSEHTGAQTQTETAPKTTIVRAGKAGSQSSAVLTATEDFLKQRGSRAFSGEILEALIAKGIEVAGNKPSAVVASYLSHSSRFNNVRGQGYGLVEWSEQKTETPNSGQLFGAPKTNGTERLSPAS